MRHARDEIRLVNPQQPPFAEQAFVAEAGGDFLHALLGALRAVEFCVAPFVGLEQMTEIFHEVALAGAGLAVEQEFERGAPVLFRQADGLFDLQRREMRAGQVAGITFDDVFADEVVRRSGEERTGVAGDEFIHGFVLGIIYLAEVNIVVATGMKSLPLHSGSQVSSLLGIGWYDKRRRWIPH